MQQHNKTPTKNPLFFAQSLKNLRKSFENESANAELYLTTASFQKPFPLQTRDFRFESLETRDFPLQTRDFPLETRDSALETRDFPSELAHFNENALILAQKGLISESTALLGSCVQLAFSQQNQRKLWDFLDFNLRSLLNISAFLLESRRDAVSVCELLSFVVTAIFPHELMSFPEMLQFKVLILNNLGCALLRLRDFKETLRVFDEALRLLFANAALQPFFALLFGNLACLFQIRGNLVKALEMTKQAWLSFQANAAISAKNSGLAWRFGGNARVSLEIACVFNLAVEEENLGDFHEALAHYQHVHAKLHENRANSGENQEFLRKISESMRRVKENLEKSKKSQQFFKFYSIRPASAAKNPCKRVLLIASSKDLLEKVGFVKENGEFRENFKEKTEFYKGTKAIFVENREIIRILERKGVLSWENQGESREEEGNMVKFLEKLKEFQRKSEKSLGKSEKSLGKSEKSLGKSEKSLGKSQNLLRNSEKSLRISENLHGNIGNFGEITQSFEEFPEKNQENREKILEIVDFLGKSTKKPQEMTESQRKPIENHENPDKHQETAPILKKRRAFPNKSWKFGDFPENLPQFPRNYAFFASRNQETQTISLKTAPKSEEKPEFPRNCVAFSEAPREFSSKNVKKIAKLQRFYAKRLREKSKRYREQKLDFLLKLAKIQRFFRVFLAKKLKSSLFAAKVKKKSRFSRFFRKFPDNIYCSVDIFVDFIENEAIFVVKRLKTREIESQIVENVEKHAEFLGNYLRFRRKQLFSSENPSKITSFFPETGDHLENLPEEPDKTPKQRFDKGISQSFAKESAVRRLQSVYLLNFRRNAAKFKENQQILKLFQLYCRTPQGNYACFIGFSRLSAPEQTFLHGFLLRKDQKRRKLNVLEINPLIFEAFGEISRGNIWEIVNLNESQAIISFTDEVLYLTAQKPKQSPENSLISSFPRDFLYKISRIQRKFKEILSRTREMATKLHEKAIVKLELSRVFRLFNEDLLLLRTFLENPREYFAENSQIPGVLSICLYKTKSPVIPMTVTRQKFKEKLSKNQLKSLIIPWISSVSIEKSRGKPGIHVACESFEAILLKSSHKLEAEDGKKPLKAEFFAFRRNATESRALETCLWQVQENSALESRKFEEFRGEFRASAAFLRVQAQISLRKAWKKYVFRRNLRALRQKRAISRKTCYQIPLDKTAKLQALLQEKESARKLPSEETPLLSGESPESRDFSENKAFFHCFKEFDGKKHEISLFHQESFKVIVVEISRKRQISQKIVLPLAAFGLFELRSVEEFQRNHVRNLLENLRFREDKVYFNNNRQQEPISLENLKGNQAEAGNFARKSVVLKEKPDFFRITAKLSENPEGQAKVKGKTEKNREAMRVLQKKPRKYQVFEGNCAVSYDFSTDLVTIATSSYNFREIFEEIGENPRFFLIMRSFLFEYLPQMSRVRRFSESFVEVFKETYAIIYKNYRASVRLQSVFRGFSSRKSGKSAFSTTKPQKIFKKIVHFGQNYHILNFFHVFAHKLSKFPCIMLKTANFSLKTQKNPRFWLISLENSLKSVKKPAISDETLRKLQEYCRFLSNQGLSFEEAESQLRVSALLEEIDVETVEISEETADFSSKPQDFPTTSTKLNEIPAISSQNRQISREKLNKTAVSLTKIAHFFEKIRERRRFREFLANKRSKKVKRLFLRTFILRKFANFIRLDVFVQEKAVFLLTFTNLNAFARNQSKYSLEISAFSPQTFSLLLRTHVIPMNKALLLRIFSESLQIPLLSSLQLDLVFENVYAKLLHETLKLKEITAFSRAVAESSAFSKKMVVLTNAIIAIQRRFRKLKLKEKQDFLATYSRNSREEIAGVRFFRRNQRYFRAVAYRRSPGKNEFRFVARVLFEKAKSQAFYTKFIDFETDLINTKGELLVGFLMKHLEIHDKKGLFINTLPAYDVVLPETTEKTSKEIADFYAEASQNDEILEEIPRNPKESPTKTSVFVELPQDSPAKPVRKKSVFQEASKPAKIEKTHPNPLFIHHSQSKDLVLEVYYSRQKDTSFEKSDKNPVEIELDLHSLKKYSQNFDLEANNSLKNLASELANSLKLSETGAILIDSNKINPKCLRVSSKVAKTHVNFQEDADTHPDFPRDSKKLAENLGFFRETPRKDVVFKAIKWFNGEKYMVTGSVLEKHIEKIAKTASADDEFLENYEVSLSITAYKQSGLRKLALSPLTLTLTVPEGLVLVPRAGSSQEILATLLEKLRICDEYFILELDFPVNMQRLRAIRRENPRKIIFIRSQTLRKIKEIAASLKKKLFFLQYQQRLREFQRVFAKSAFFRANVSKTFACVLAQNEKDGVSLNVWDLKSWRFVAEMRLAYEKYKIFLVSPKKWRGFLEKCWECVEVLGEKEMLLDEEKLVSELLKEINRQKIQEIEENLEK